MSRAATTPEMSPATGPRPGGGGAGSYFVLLSALFISGASGLVNQITWQRAVKVYLANSETLSATIVVLVFMLGLGVGSIVAARKSAGLANPFRFLGGVEVSLAITNGLLIFLFGEKLQRLVYALLAASDAAGLPPRLLYASLSFAVLSLPCFLMGLTIPVAAEAAQRQLDVSRTKAVSHIFAMNTAGAVVGTLGGGLFLMPVYGQKVALAVAAAGNLLAGLLVLGLLSGRTASPTGDVEAGGRELLLAALRRKRTLRFEEVLAFCLGALSLGYEIYLFRIVALAYTPLPWIFSTVLCCFLLFWAAGLAFAGSGTGRLSTPIALTALTVAFAPSLLAWQRSGDLSLHAAAAGLLYFVPCFGFGALFGRTIERYAERWGHDVGVFTALNTAGCGAGILVTTFVLFEMDSTAVAWILAAGLAGLVPWLFAKENPGSLLGRHRSWGTTLGALLPVAAVSVGLSRVGPVARDGRLGFFGRDGVVEVEAGGRVFIDGLWHSVLYRDSDLAAKKTPNVRRKMLIALLPYLAHDGDGPLDVLNIGMGTGATARTLAKSSAVASVDAYEINGTLKDVIAMFPEESLGTSRLDKITVLWEDARTGLVRREKKYDVITQSPLYLKQSGSSFLLSRQYFELLKSRLKEGGIVGIYCNAQGNAEQALLVRKTVTRVFSYYESFGRGYFILASNRPIALTRENFGRKLVHGDPVADDIRLLGIDEVLAGCDRPRLDWDSSPWIVTDDHPLVEHPAIAHWLFRLR